MNSLIQNDLQAYLRRLVEEHLPSKGIARKRNRQTSFGPRKLTSTSNPSPRSKSEEE